MKRFRFASMVCLVALWMACSPMTFDYSYNAKTDFTKLKTYDWMPIPQDVQVREQVVQGIKSTANTQLEAKGFVQKSEQPDFLIAVHGQKESKTQVTDWGDTYSRSQLYYYGLSSREVYTTTEGTLTLDVIDATTKKMVWQGTATSAVYADPTPQEQEKTITKAVKGMLKNFPPDKK